jgi:hypothetical protein
MRLPALEATIERRLLINYRVDPDVVAPLLPPPLQPQLVHDWAVAGICLIRLTRVRPRGVPRIIGHSSENAAHRIAVEWDAADGHDTGVFIPRRDTNSVTNVLAGGRLFPGEHHYARITTRATPESLSITIDSQDPTAAVDVTVEPADTLSDSMLFPDLQAASAFFEQGSAGYSATRNPNRLDGLALTTHEWRLEPLHIRAAKSGFFADPQHFPTGSALLDSAFLMRNVQVEWHALPPLTIAPAHLPHREQASSGIPACRAVRPVST